VKTRPIATAADRGGGNGHRDDTDRSVWICPQTNRTGFILPGDVLAPAKCGSEVRGAISDVHARVFRVSKCTQNPPILRSALSASCFAMRRRFP
jgi:hypothetical protein